MFEIKDSSIFDNPKNVPIFYPNSETILQDGRYHDGWPGINFASF